MNRGLSNKALMEGFISLFFGKGLSEQVKEARKYMHLYEGFDIKVLEDFVKDLEKRNLEKEGTYNEIVSSTKPADTDAL